MLDLLRAAGRLVLPVECAGCGLPDVPCCAACTAALRGDGPLVVREAVGRGAVGGEAVGGGCGALWCATDYAGRARRLVLAWKERGRHDLTPLLGAALAPAVAAGWAAAGSAAPVLLVPVPSARSAVRRRGGWLVEELAVATARELRRQGVPARVAPLLVLARTPRDQRLLTAPQRRANLAGAHRARPRARGVRCLVLDDVTTTGSTLDEAARALTAAGAVVVGRAAVAVTRRGDPGLVTASRDD